MSNTAYPAAAGNRAQSRATPSRDPVLRHTVDHRSPDATRRRPFSTGRPSDARIRIRALLQVADEVQRKSIEEGPKRYRGVIGHLGSKLLGAVLKHLNYGRGSTDSALSQLADEAAFRDRKTVMRVRDQLIAAGFLETVRRSAPTGAPKRFGVPQRQQISNLTIPTPHRLPAEQFARYKELCGIFRAEESARFRKLTDAAAASPQQRAERRAARRKAALVDRPAVKRSSDTPAPLARLNPRGAARVIESVKLSFDRSAADEAEQARKVAANLDFFLAAIERDCGKQASPS